MPKMIGPGASLVCVKTAKCDCGSCGVTKGSIYMCEEIAADFMHAIVCPLDGCSGVVIAVVEKHHALCACVFAPLDDGDDSMIRGEKPESYDDMLKRDDVRAPETVDAK